MERRCKGGPCKYLNFPPWQSEEGTTQKRWRSALPRCSSCLISLWGSCSGWVPSYTPWALCCIHIHRHAPADRKGTVLSYFFNIHVVLLCASHRSIGPVGREAISVAWAVIDALSTCKLVVPQIVCMAIGHVAWPASGLTQNTFIREYVARTAHHAPSVLSGSAPATLPSRA